MSPGDKTYLGDGAYARVDNYGSVILTTEDGVSDTNRIVLDEDVLGAFTAWLDEMRSRGVLS